MANVLKKFLKEFPYSEIQTVKVDGNYMTYFPKTYVKVIGNGKAGAIWYFSDKPKEDFHLHHSFYKFNSAGEEVENGVLHSAYVASKKDGKAVSSGAEIWGKVNYETARASAQSAGAGYDMLNIYDYHFRGILMLMETLAMGYETADVQRAIAGSDGAVDVEHYGIKDIWGGKNCGFWIYGLDTADTLGISNKNIHILGRHGEMEDTGIKPAGRGYPVTFHTQSSDEYNLGDIMLGATVEEQQSKGSCGDSQNLDENGGQAFAASWIMSGKESGPFHLMGVDPRYENAARTFALRKAV